MISIVQFFQLSFGDAAVSVNGRIVATTTDHASEADVRKIADNLAEALDVGLICHTGLPQTDLARIGTLVEQFHTSIRTVCTGPGAKIDAARHALAEVRMCGRDAVMYDPKSVNEALDAFDYTLASVREHGWAAVLFSPAEFPAGMTAETLEDTVGAHVATLRAG